MRTRFSDFSTCLALVQEVEVEKERKENRTKNVHDHDLVLAKNITIVKEAEATNVEVPKEVVVRSESNANEIVVTEMIENMIRSHLQATENRNEKENEFGGFLASTIYFYNIFSVIFYDGI